MGGFAGERAWAVDATGTPTITSTPESASTYKVGEDIEVDITFDGVVYVQEDEDSGELELILSIGQHSRKATYVDGSGNSDMKLHFRYTVQSGDEDGDGISIAQGTDSLVGGVLVDGDSMDVGRGFTALGAQSSHKVDGIIPTVTTGGVTIESTPDSGTTYGLAETIEVEVDFDEVVHVDETVSELVLILSIGQHSRRATFVGGSGSTTLSFSYSVQRGDEDDDGISIGSGPGALQGATIADFAGNPADRTFDAVGENANHKVDGVTPSLNAASITSAPESGDTYGLNEEIRVAVAFGEVVHATDPDDNLELILSIGQHSRSAKLADGSGTMTLIFAYTVQSDDEDDDGISIGPTALQGGILQDAAGNPVDRNFGGRAADSDHKVDGVEPSLKVMRIVSSPANVEYGLNEEIRVEVDFDEEVHVDETEDELVLVLAIGQHSRSATFVEGSGTETLKFSYVVQSGDYDVDGVSIGPGINANEGSLRGAELHDKAGNRADRSYLGLAANSAHKVDGVRPSMKRVDIASTPLANDTYGLNEQIRVEVDFGEVVFVDETDDELTLVLSVGQHSRPAAYLDGGGTDTLVFGYTVQADDLDTDGISIGPNALRGGVISDTAGNLVDRTSAGVAAKPDHKVDGRIISRAPIRIVSTPVANATYGLNEEINVEVTFGEAVHVTGALKLILSIGANDREASFVGGSGTSTVTFRYVVQSDDKDDDGISIRADALEGGTILNGQGDPVSRSIAGLDPDRGHRVDGISPALSGVEIVSNPGSRGIYRLNEEIMVEVKFGEVVHVTDAEQAPTLLISIGENLRAATLAGGSGTDKLTFSYVVQSDDKDDDGISIGANALQGGDIEDVAGNPVERSFAGLPADSEHKVDGENPSLVSVRFASRSGADGTYGLGDEIKVAVEFSEEVHVTNTEGDLSLLLSIGRHSREAVFEGGSGTDTLTFTYVVQAEDYDEDGISIGPTSLRGGVIEDEAGNEVDRTFAGRAADSRHKVDGSDSSGSRTPVSIVSTPGASGFYGLGDEIRIEVEFGEEVHVEAGPPTLVLSIGEHLRSATMTGGSGTDTLTFRYVVQTDDYDDDGISTGPNPLRGGTIQDVVGNDVDRSFVTLAADSGHKVDGVSPSLEEVRIVSTPANNDTYGWNEAIRVEVEFGEEVHVTTADLSLTLSIGEHLRAATYVSGSGTDTLTFRYVVQSGDSDEDGISIGASALTGDGIEDVAGNAVSPTFDGLEADSDHKVDGIGPELTAVRFASTPDATGYYGLGDAIMIEVEFGEEVHVTSGEAELSLMLSIGQHLRAATFVSGSGTDTLTFRYMVQAGDSDEDGISIGPSALQGGTIADAAGNVVERSFAGLAADMRHKVKAGVALVPAVVRLDLTSDAGSNDTYTTDDDIRIEVVFNVPVHVRGDAPVLSLTIGSVERDAAFQEGSGTRVLKFQYTVELGDTDDDGISIGPNALVGNIEDGSGNGVDLTLPALAAQPSHKVSAELMLYPLSLTLLVGQEEIVNLTDQLALLEVDYDGHFEVTSDDSSIVKASLSGRMLTIASVAEGAATITAKAVDAAIYLFFGVTVETSPAETAVLEGALAAVGRGMIASAGSTIGGRLETTGSGSEDVWAGPHLAPTSVRPHSQWSAFDRIDQLGRTFGHGHWGGEDPYLERSTSYTLAQWLRGARFEMPFGGFGNPINSWSVWGAGDWHAFEGEPESGLYDGSLTSVYLGVDARGNGWISGAAVSHAIADASYEFGGDFGGKGRLQTELNVIHPYLQWALRERGKVWAIFGFGTGEATAEREGQEASKSTSDLSMLMGLGGMRYAFGPWAGFDFAVRGDAGFAQLETDEGPRAIQGLTVNVQRVRMGVEASLPMAFVGIPVSPFIDVAGRYDGGDGATGGGLEMAGGFRYRGPMVGFEMKARALAMHTDESYSEEGVKATLIVGPDGRRGFRVLLSPRWGGTAEAMDIFSYRGQPFAGALHRVDRGWGLGTRISYGFDMRRRPGTIMPYWELDLSRDAHRQARLGVSYELASPFAGMPHRLELSGESTESDRHGSIMRFLLSGQAHF